MTDTEKMVMTNIIGNFVADNNAFGMEVLAHHPHISRNMGIGHAFRSIRNFIFIFSY